MPSVKGRDSCEFIFTHCAILTHINMALTCVQELGVLNQAIHLLAAIRNVAPDHPPPVQCMLNGRMLGAKAVLRFAKGCRCTLSCRAGDSLSHMTHLLHDRCSACSAAVPYPAVSVWSTVWHCLSRITPGR